MPNEALAELQRRVKFSSQKEVAKTLRVTPQFICDILKGRRDVTDKIARGLGFKRSIVFIPLPPKKSGK